MKSLSSQENCQVNVVYVTSCSSESLLHAAYAISSVLFLSNGIRYWASLKLVLRIRIDRQCSSYLLEILGKKIKWLRPGERNLLGFLNTLLEGRHWPGASLTRLGGLDYTEMIPSSCIPIDRYVKETSTCPSCIVVNEEKLGGCLKPWWLLASVMVVDDARCRWRCS